MFLDFVSALPVGAGHVQWPSGRTTLVVKVCLRFGPSGVLELDRTAPTLGLDRADATGALAHPSDYAPYKPRCDVAVVGPAVLDRAAPGYLVAGALTRRAAAGEPLGTHPSVGATGHPLAADVVDALRGGEVDFARFQAAPPERQMVHPNAPFAVQYARGSSVVSGRFDGPFLRAFVASGEPTRIVGRVPLALDTVLVDPVAGAVFVLFRGIYDRTYPAGLPERVVLDAGPGAPPDPATFTRWQPVPIAAPFLPEPPRTTRPIQGQTSPLVPQETSVLVLPAGGDALPFSSVGFDFEEETHTVDKPAPRGWEEDTTAAGIRPAGPTLPFQRMGGAPAAPRGPTLDLAALRAASAQPVADAWGTDETRRTVLVGQQLVPIRPVLGSAPDAAPARPAQGAPMVHMPSAHGAPVSPFGAPTVAAPLLIPSTVPAAPPPALAPPAPLPERPAPLGAPSPAAPTAADPADAARVQAIMQEIWKGHRPLAEILAAHGLTESAWREMRRNAGRRT